MKCFKELIELLSERLFIYASHGAVVVFVIIMVRGPLPLPLPISESGEERKCSMWNLLAQANGFDADKHLCWYRRF